MSILHAFFVGAALTSAAQLVAWQRQRRSHDATAVDVVWSASIGALALVHAALGDGSPARRVAVATLACCASVRLTSHLVSDRLRKAVEDPRYRTLRVRFGRAAQRNFFVLFQAQALLAAALSLVFALASASRAPFGALDAFAFALGAGALLGESIADRQLARFRADPRNRGRTCRTGLWSVSRHPNYFFQWLIWCAYALLAWSAPAGELALAAPLAMLFLILRVTGIPPAEAQALRSRGDDYRDYQRTTSAFVPWFPRATTAP